MVCWTFCVLIFLKIYSTVAATGCAISINKDLNALQPLLIKEIYGSVSFLEPTWQTDEIFIKENDNFEVYCPGGTVLANGVNLSSNRSFVSCFRGKFYINKIKIISFNTITCSKSLKHQARPSEVSCLGSGKEFVIGYEYSTMKFLSLITGCFDNIAKNTLYTKSTIQKTIARYQSGHPRPTHWNQGFFNLTNANDFYTRSTQKLTINNLLGLNEDSTKYIARTGDYYLSRGHLVPRVDFLFGSQQDATFYLANSAPQWQNINVGNWKVLEQNIRDMASVRKIDLTVYTGTFETLTFPYESTGKQTELFLYAKLNEKKIPVPKYIWKIVIDEGNATGVAFISVNNPYIKDKDIRDYTLCPNICNSLTYLTLSLNYTKKGYVYCCEIKLAKSSIGTIPSFVTAKNLLK